MQGFLSNTWIDEVRRDYSYLLGFLAVGVPWIIYKVLHIVAVLNPNIKSNTIKELLSWKGTAPTPGEEKKDAA